MLSAMNNAAIEAMQVQVTPANAVAMHLESPNLNTKRTYTASMREFGEFSGFGDAAAAGVAFISLEETQAMAVAKRYLSWLMQRNVSAATIKTRVAALRSMTKLARQLKLTTWTLELSVKGIGKSRSRSTHGPSTPEIREMFAATAAKANARTAARDTAIIALMYDLGQRRQSVIDLDLEDVDLVARRVQVKLKGRVDREEFTIPTHTAPLLARWIEIRGDVPGPLFIRCDNGAPTMQRIGGEAARRLVKRAGRLIGVDTHPHALRHSAATAVARATGDVYSVQKFLRHENAATSQIYIDNMDDKGAAAAEVVAAGRML